jgi:hypothetical protein
MQFVSNILLTQFGWFTSVFGGANQMPWLGPLTVLVVVALHLKLAKRPERELALIVLCGVIGTIFDSVLVYFGWVGYPSGMFAAGLAPYWIIAMWMLFATTLNVSLKWLRRMPVVAAGLGLVAGPLTYLAGAKLGGIVLIDRFAALAMLAVGWAIMMPALSLLAARFDGMTPRLRSLTTPA